MNILNEIYQDLEKVCEDIRGIKQNIINQAKVESKRNNGSGQFRVKRVYHYRNPQSRGGITIVIGNSGNDKMMGISMCSPDDQFCRKTGIALAKASAFKMYGDISMLDRIERIPKNTLFQEIFCRGNIRFDKKGEERVAAIERCFLKNKDKIDYIDIV